jgi:hypothetical protein
MRRLDRSLLPVSYKEEKNLAHVELALVWANAPGMFTIGSIFMAAVPERRKAIF